MRYKVEEREIIITNVMVEADSKEEAEDKAREAVENGYCSPKGAILDRDSDTEIHADLRWPEYQEGGEYYTEDKRLVIE
jgi:hypothetical protein